MFDILLEGTNTLQDFLAIFLLLFVLVCFGLPTFTCIEVNQVTNHTKSSTLIFVP